MNEPNYESDPSSSIVQVTQSPVIVSNTPSVSWNPDAIDVTVNPNKMRKITTEKEHNGLSLISTTSRNNEINLGSLGHANSNVNKDSVLRSDDYKRWQEMKNSFLGEPFTVSTTTMRPIGTKLICICFPDTFQYLLDLKPQLNSELKCTDL